MGTRTHFGLSSEEMISTGSRCVIRGAVGSAGVAPSCLFHVYAEKAGMARKVITSRGAAFVQSSLIN